MEQDNIFLDGYTPIEGGKIATYGKDLNKIPIPKIKTLVYSEELQINPIFTYTELENKKTNILDDVFSYNQEQNNAIPKTYAEALKVLDRIKGERSSNKMKSFNIFELREIAKNLNVGGSRAKKSTLAENIKNAIEAYYSSLGNSTD